MMRIDLLIAEIGSTTTIVNAFTGLGDNPVFLGSGSAPTTVHRGERPSAVNDVRVGLDYAIQDLCVNLAVDDIDYTEMLATSSAAGGLRMTVHGLVPEMTARAAREAALGAGAVIKFVTGGVLTEYDLKEIDRINPNIILLAGGTDYGERDTQIKNAETLCRLTRRVPVIYAGNRAIIAHIGDIFASHGFDLTVTENVYPRLDELNIEPARQAVSAAFMRHIVHAEGMEGIADRAKDIMTTPGAVLEATKLMYGEMGDCVTIDVGGATTDVHSAADGSDEVSQLSVEPQPTFKRTVEGDLGVYVNAVNVAKLYGLDRLAQDTGISDIDGALADLKPIPDQSQQRLTGILAKTAAETALLRHIGRFRYIYGATGRKVYTEGKDLTCVKYLVATGGALTRLSDRRCIMEGLKHLNTDGKLLFPKAERLSVLYDESYIMASLGVMSKAYPDDARKLLLATLKP